MLYGRICEDMTTAEVAAALGLSVTTAENYSKAARRRLAEVFELLVARACGGVTPSRNLPTASSQPSGPASAIISRSMAGWKTPSDELTPASTRPADNCVASALTPCSRASSPAPASRLSAKLIPRGCRTHRPLHSVGY